MSDSTSTIRISCIIPAYNEESRIGKVLELATTHPLISEVIVIDDRSKDKTLEVIRKFPSVRLIAHEKNTGKSGAVYDGIKAATGDYLFMLDSDLIGLSHECMTALIRPVLDGIADVSISLRRNAPKTWHRIGIDYISGERILPKALFDGHLDKIRSLSGYALEVFMNGLIIKKRYRIKIVLWADVDSPWKYKKTGSLWKGIKGEIRMMWDIICQVTPIGPFWQIYKMRQLMVK